MKYFKKLAFSLMLIMVAFATASQTFATSTVDITADVYINGTPYSDVIDIDTFYISWDRTDLYLAQFNNESYFTVDMSNDDVGQIIMSTSIYLEVDIEVNVNGTMYYDSMDINDFNFSWDGTELYINNFDGQSYFTIDTETNDLGNIHFSIDSEPVLDGETAFVTNVDNPISESTIRSYITAYDETDGNITHLIQLVSDNYTANKYILGSYTLNYSVTDSAGNTATLAVTVLVKDVTSPVGTDDQVSVSYTQTFDIAQYMSENGLAFTDNYEDPNELTYVVDFNDYTANKTTPGTYYVDIVATDTSGNEGVATLTIQVIDDVAPTFSGPTTITKNTSETLTLTQIKSQLTANDVIDGSLTSSIVVVEDNYTGHGNVVGSYTILFSVTDASGNVSNHTITVTAVDNIPPVFYVADGYFITVEQSVSLTLEDFKDILIATGQLDASGTGDIVIVSSYNEYFGNENEPGIYALTLTGSSPSGDEFVWNLAVEVLEDEDQDTVVATDNPWYVDLYNDYQDIILGVAGIIVIIISIISLIAIRKHIKKTKRNSYKRK